MIIPKDGKPPGPGQAADGLALLALLLIVLMRKRAQLFRKRAFAIFTLLLTFGLSLGDDAHRQAAAASAPPLYDVIVVLGNGGSTPDVSNYRRTIRPPGGAKLLGGTMRSSNSPETRR